jgi:rRNA maturation protein Rpf1
MQKQPLLRILKPLLTKSNQGRIVLPILLITTSRKTSNRVRSFARDLWTVLPGTERFNRGGMGLTELAARVGQSGAKAALVISMWKGNPSLLIFTTSTGDEVVTIKMESAKLRREVNPTKNSRFIGIAGVFIKSGSSEKTRELGEVLSSFLDVEMLEKADPEDAQIEENWSLIWLEDMPSGKILWTHYQSRNGIEIGPRIRVTSLRRNE